MQGIFFLSGIGLMIAATVKGEMSFTIAFLFLVLGLLYFAYDAIAIHLTEISLYLFVIAKNRETSQETGKKPPDNPEDYSPIGRRKW